ncbi:MAG: hypothetical protein ACYC3L_12890 [Gemmatimonadaceae bacterium]
MKKIAFVVALASVAGCQGQSVSAPASGPYFPQVRAIVQANCTSCHTAAGTGEPRGLPVMFETDQQIADLSAAIKAATIDPVSPRNKRMPYGGELSAADKDIILKWYNKGGRVTD